MNKVIQLTGQTKIEIGYHRNKTGVYYQGIDKNGKPLPLMKLSDDIELIGRGIDKERQQYRIIRYQDHMSEQAKIEALPCAEIGTRVGWSRLQGLGLVILTNRRKHELLSDYLQSEGSNETWIITNQSGWILNNQAYILPSGEILYNEQKPLKIIYNGNKGNLEDYKPTGSMEDWQRNIGRYIANNSRLMLALGASLAPVLMRPLNIEAGGFHLFGDSRTGKSTLGNLAASIWGRHESFVSSWRGTGLGFENLANGRNDGLLVLDEIGEARTHIIEQVAYSVINGRSKIQGAKEGGNREYSQWKVLMFSTGEKTLEGYIQTQGGQWQAGQATRLPSIPADAGKGYGIYDTLHDANKGSLLSESINEVIKCNYGLIGRTFVLGLIREKKAFAETKTLINQFINKLPEMDGQARTVALRFALVFASLVMATRLNVIKLEESDIFIQIKKCFDDWLEREGTGKREDKIIIANAVDFMQSFAHSCGFVKLTQQGELDTTPNDLLGYTRKNENQSQDEFFILPKIFINKICKGYEQNKVCTVLHEIGWLKKYETDKQSRWKSSLKIKGKVARFFLLVGSLPHHDKME